MQIAQCEARTGAHICSRMGLTGSQHRTNNLNWITTGKNKSSRGEAGVKEVFDNRVEWAEREFYSANSFKGVAKAITPIIIIIIVDE